VITIGVDAHKQVHAAVAVDDAGRDVARWRGPNTRAAWDELHRWTGQLGDERQWGIEGAGGYGRGLAQRLVDLGEGVFEVNSRWTASGRRRARNSEKTDALDATAVARTVRQEGSALPRVQPDDESSILSVLTTERDELVRESNRIRSQIHHLLLQVDPEYKGQIGRLTTRRSLGALSQYAAPDGGALQEHRAAAVRRLAVRLELVTGHIDDVSLQIKELAAARFPALMRLCGVNALTAGVLAGLLGPGQRFANDAQLAAYAGVAPLEASSGMRVRHRLSRRGNRRLNSVIYWIVLTQAHHSSEARAYLARRMSQGKTRREAHRALRRYIARALWRLWVECHTPSVSMPLQAAA
jgi:transposase